MTIQRFVRFIPRSGKPGGGPLLGQPIDQELDIGKATMQGEDVKMRVFTGSSVLHPGAATDRVESIGTLLAPLSQQEVGTIRCVGLNYMQHVEEVHNMAIQYKQQGEETKMQIPSEPTIFLKPATALADPYPAPTIIPKFTIASDSADYEAELAIVIGSGPSNKVCKDVSETEAFDYVLGYTASNDVSSRASQFTQSQWCFSKGFDGSCPIGPCLVLAQSIPDPRKLMVRGLKNGRVMQDCGFDDCIFPVEKIVSFVSQGTTLPPGTVIITGTPAGVGVSRKPQEFMRDGDVFEAEILPHVGTLGTKYVNER